MADTLPINFQLPGENAISTYNYTDVASGLGYVEFMGFKENGGTYYLTDNSAVYSQTSVTTISAGGTFNQDFTTSTFNTPRILQGRLIANIPFYRAAGNSAKVTTTITIYHVTAGGSATSLGSATGDSVTTSAAHTTDNFMQCFIISLSQKNFKIGEYIKINVTAVAGNEIYYIGHDPANRSYNSVLTKMNFLIPFKIQI